jgi:hypothetical protein
MKTKNILFLLLAFLLVVTFFFKIIPIPLENMEGAKNADKFIYGGIYWTSMLEQLSLGNYLALLPFIGIHFVLLFGISLMKFKN